MSTYVYIKGISGPIEWKDCDGTRTEVVADLELMHSGKLTRDSFTPAQTKDDAGDMSDNAVHTKQRVPDEMTHTLPRPTPHLRTKTFGTIDSVDQTHCWAWTDRILAISNTAPA